MQNAIEKTEQKWKSGADATAKELKGFSPEEVKNAAADITQKVRDVSTRVYGDSLSYVRSNPVRATLGFGAAAFVLGMIAGKMRK